MNKLDCGVATRRSTTLLAVALVTAMPLLAHGAEKDQRYARAEESHSFSREETSARLQRRSLVAPVRTTMSREYVGQRIEWLRVRHPEHARALAYFDTLMVAGYDPFLLDAWLDGLYDGVVVVGMPGDLVLNYFGDPLSRVDVVYEGAPAQVWGVRLLPGRIEKVTVAAGKVVRVRG